MEHKKKKVLIVYHSCDIGPAKAIFNAIGSREDIELKVLGPERGWNPFRGIWHTTPKQKKEEHYEIVSGKIFFPQKSCANPYITGLLREIVRFNPDIIHVMNEVTSLVLFQALVLRMIFAPRAKVLFWGAENLLDQKFERGNLIKKAIWRFNARHIDGGGYVNSEGVAQLKAMGFSVENIVVSYWGIDLEKYKRKNVKPLAAAHGLKERFVIGYVGRISEEKGLSTVLEAMRDLPEDVTFVALGNGSYLDKMKKKAGELGMRERFVHFEQVEDFEVADYLSLFDLLVLPSRTTRTWKEQFGRVIAEAMTCGVPVVGSSSGSIPEALKGTGYIFQEGDPKDLAEKIKEYRGLSSEKKEAEVELVRRTARENYSTSVFAEKFNHVYEKALKLS